MQKWNIQELALAGACLIDPFVAEDERGRFVKDYSREVLDSAGIRHDLKEVFYTYSRPGVVRALHFQHTKEQPKLVRCVWGHVWDAIVDLRPDSPTYMKWMGFDLTGENHRELLVPPGFAHGYLVLEESVVSYKCAERFYSEYDAGVRWDDPELAVRWPLELIGGRGQVILSDKDKGLPSLREWEESI